MLSASQEIKDANDFSWLYTHPNRCNICGCPIIEGEMIQSDKLIQTYPVGRAHLFSCQWHVDCVQELYEQ